MLKRITALNAAVLTVLITASCGVDMKKVQGETSAAMIDIIELLDTSVAKIEAAPSAEDAASAAEMTAAEMKITASNFTATVNKYNLTVEQDDELQKTLTKEFDEMVNSLTKLNDTINSAMTKYADKPEAVKKLNQALIDLEKVMR